MIRVLFFAFVLLFSSANAVELILSGTAVSDNQKVLASRNMGYLKKINVDEGDEVKKGELLYEIDPTELNAQKQMNRNQLDNVLKNLERYERLFKKGMVSKYDLENMRLAAENQKEMLRISEAQDAYLKVLAPNDGIIISKNMNEGEMVNPGMPVVVLTDLTDIKIVIEISENDLKSIKKGDKVKVEIPSIELNTVGEISSIIPASNPMTHKFKAKIKFDKAGKNVYPGMFARVTLEL
ncbi:MAG: efflux RND transporter periplasmic adaptor subunit [Campylobacterales bacterium]|nr:efflux RND transporter periplasmic adaptor subunit [Campylobacterales bacterium]